MAKDAKIDASKETPDVNSIVSVEQTAQIAQNLVRALKVFSADQGYRDLAELVDRIPKLERAIQEKEKRLKEVSVDLEKQSKNHAAELKRNLWLYSEESARFQKEKEALDHQIKGLEKNILQNSKTISDLEKRVEELKTGGRKYEDALKSKSAKLKEKEAELSKMTKQEESSRIGMQNLSLKLQGVQNDASALKNSLDQSEHRSVRLDEELKKARGMLKDLQNFSISLENTDIKSVGTTLDKLWDSATLLVRDVFGQDLPEDLLKHPWTMLDNSAKYVIDGPLPHSNSAIAKELRVIKVLAILAEVMDEYIFQPTYLLPEESQFKELLYRVASKDPDKERFLRGMMLSILQGEQRNEENRVVTEAMKEVMRESGVEEVIPQVQKATFEESLRELLKDAQEAWRAVQCSIHIIVCDFEYTQIAGFEWQSFKIQVGSTTGKGGSSKSSSVHDPDDVVVLFPRSYLMMPEEEPKPITTGTILQRSQTRAMMREERENMPRTEQALTRSRNRSGRTLSVSADATRGGQTKEAFLSRAVASSKRSNG